MDDVYYDADEEAFLLRRLRSCPEIFSAIADSSTAELSSQRKLRNEFDDDLVRAALSVHEARQRAAGLLPQAEQLWMTRVGLEQSTAWDVAAHKAKRFSKSENVSDLCCGIGVDAAAIAETTHVAAIDAQTVAHAVEARQIRRGIAMIIIVSGEVVVLIVNGDNRIQCAVQ